MCSIRMFTKPTALKSIRRSFSGTVLQNFVPKHSPASDYDLKLIEDFIFSSKRLFILTGAGISTESGIPDYRSEEVGLYARSNHKPIVYSKFLNSPILRQRYWARNFVGWDRFSGCLPNATHNCVKNLEIDHNVAQVVVTQNVDNLHFKAGSRNVIELHGSSYKVVCLHCKNTYGRHELQQIIKMLNPNMIQDTSKMIRPDGDVEISEELYESFKSPICDKCGGILKPDIVFFGDVVPKERVQQVENYLSHCDAVLVLGSSLTVYSSYRIILQAVEENKKIAMINIGPTRADNLIKLKVSAKCGDILPKIC